MIFTLINLVIVVFFILRAAVFIVKKGIREKHYKSERCAISLIVFFFIIMY